MIRNLAMDSRTSDTWSNEMIEKFIRERNMMMLAVHDLGSGRDILPAMYDAMSSGRRLKTELEDVIDRDFDYRDHRRSRTAYLSKPFVLPLDLDIEGVETGN